MVRMCSCPTQHFRQDAKTRDPAISHQRASVHSYQKSMVPMSQQSPRLDAEWKRDSLVCRRQMEDNAMRNTWWCTGVRVFQELL